VSVQSEFSYLPRRVLVQHGRFQGFSLSGRSSSHRGLHVSNLRRSDPQADPGRTITGLPLAPTPSSPRLVSRRFPTTRPPSGSAFRSSESRSRALRIATPARRACRRLKDSYIDLGPRQYLNKTDRCVLPRNGPGRIVRGETAGSLGRLIVAGHGPQRNNRIANCDAGSYAVAALTDVGLPRRGPMRPRPTCAQCANAFSIPDPHQQIGTDAVWSQLPRKRPPTQTTASALRGTQYAEQRRCAWVRSAWRGTTGTR
jgi:hypothetical protein